MLPMLTKATMVEGNHEIGIMPAYSWFRVINSAPPVELIIQSVVISEASEILSELNQPTFNWLGSYGPILRLKSDSFS